VNLLHLAVILAAIPGRDPAVDGVVEDRLDEDAASASDDADPPPPLGEVGPDAEPNDPELAAAERAIDDANDESQTILDSLFPTNPHVTIVIEEPEAHLHPQLQHGLTRHLRRVVERRPELQVIMTTHSSEVISGGSVRDLVVLKRHGDKTTSRSPRNLPLTDSVRDRVLKMADRHLDVTRSAALFAPYLCVVEGVTDAMLVRQFGHVWAAGDDRRVHFVDGLTITMAGSRIGDWIPRLLATPGFEIVERLAILGDEDKIGEPPWLPDFAGGGRVRCCLSKPTLEPSLVESNGVLVEAALERIGGDLGNITQTTVSEYFGKNGTGASKKAEFAEAIVDLIEGGVTVTVPSAIAEALDFLWQGFSEASSPDGANEPEVAGDPEATD
jgi:putative ATP-dependent endonuclease of OLD family